MPPTRLPWLLLFGQVACSAASAPGEPSPDGETTVASVTVTPSPLLLESGDVGAATCSPKNAKGTALDTTCTWASSDTSVVRVTPAATQAMSLTAGQPGSATVTVTVTGSSVATALAVTVTAPPPPPCDTSTTDLVFAGNMETAPPPFPRGATQGINWFGMELSQVGNYPYSFTQVTSPIRECGTAVRFELHRADSNIAGQKRAQIINVYPAGFGDVPLPSGTTIGGGLGDERWIGFSVYVPATWVFETGYAPETIFEMLEGSRTPGFEININGANWQIQNQTGHGPQGDPSWEARNDYTPVTRGAWTDWVIHVVWSGETTGVVQVWKNGAIVVNRSGTWTTYTDAKNAKVDWGIYKWSWNGAPAGGASIVSTRDLVLDAVRITDGAHGSYAVVAPR